MVNAALCNFKLGGRPSNWVNHNFYLQQMKPFFLLILTIAFLQSSAQNIFHPYGLDSIGGATGDLDKDGIVKRQLYLILRIQLKTEL